MAYGSLTCSLHRDNQLTGENEKMLCIKNSSIPLISALTPLLVLQPWESSKVLDFF